MYPTIVMMTMMMMRYPENACTFYPSHTIFSEATSYADCADEHQCTFEAGAAYRVE